MSQENELQQKNYRAYVQRKITIIFCGHDTHGNSVLLFFVSVSVGAVSIPIPDIIATLFKGHGAGLYEHIHHLGTSESRKAMTAVVAGAWLAIAGVAMQSILRNPLASPFTLGLSNAAAFGATVGILLFRTGTTGSIIADAVVVNNPYLTTISAFVFSMLTTVIILLIAKMRSATPETMVLAGVAISSLFSAGLIAIQYFVDNTKLASIVFWQFGDVA